ncbi:ABC transporter substrate-binding protein [Paenibacillus sp. p3-SID867]|uniref:ABC transporter substrate-binding protein n=1 Tax=Paenibacillus sp. p3-SID867 TaxID=2916363 RepID=UPI0021A33EFC|nr:ABC transporter substrate-binding protein [Paenibacillus sp. p3-SID867]MCT1403017.1 ABC transporter substrate-binding protein [Paenibacillus sp. p3-SID867]
MRKRLGIVFLIIAALISGCSSVPQDPPQETGTENATDRTDPNVEKATPSAEEAASNEEGKNSEATFKDVTGTEISVDLPVEKIACLTEICVDALGLKPAAVTAGGLAPEPEFYGEEAASLGQIGGSFFEPNLEDISLAGPDLVIGLEGTHEGLREGLAGIAPLYIVQPKSMQESIEFLQHMGQLTGRIAEAEAAEKRLLDKFNFYKEHSPKDKTALVMYGSDVNFGIDTAGSLVGSVLAEVTQYPWPAPEADGGHQAGGMAYSLEKVLENDPDYIFVETFTFSPDSQPLSEQFKTNPLWSRLSAVKNGQVHEMRTSVWASGRGTRSLGIILDEAMSILYPELYKKAVE